MYKVKLEDDKVVIYFNIEVGKFNQIITYKADLEDKTYTCFESGEEIQLDWEDVKCEIEKEYDQIITDVKSKIINNKTVIGSYKMKSDESKTEKDLKEIEKAEKHLVRNKRILEYLQNYNFNG
jgi:hypothetical protein